MTTAVLVIGVGVAGLMAIATARRLGAVVEAFDIRPAVREEVQSLGATFVGVELTEETVAAGGYAQEVSVSSQQQEQEVIKISEDWWRQLNEIPFVSCKSITAN